MPFVALVTDHVADTISQGVQAVYMPAQAKAFFASAANWFKNTHRSATKDLILREEALRLGDHGVLTSLSIHPQFVETVSKN